MAEEPSDQPRPPSRSEPEQFSAWYAMTGAGLEFVVALVMFGGLGWYLDRRWGTMPWLLLAGCALGFFVGLYAMIRMARRSFRDK